jgi:hypothetical protein
VPTDPDSDTASAGETGQAEGDTGHRTEVIVGEVPAADDPSIMLWTARCTDPSHDLLGRFATRDEAEDVKTQHLDAEHHDE